MLRTFRSFTAHFFCGFKFPTPRLFTAYLFCWYNSFEHLNPLLLIVIYLHWNASHQTPFFKPWTMQFYVRFRLIRSVLRACKFSVSKLTKIVILLVYYIPFVRKRISATLIKKKISFFNFILWNSKIKVWISNFNLWISNFNLWISILNLWISNFNLWISNFILWNSKIIFWISNFNLWTSNFILWNSKIILWISNFNLWISNFILWNSKIILWISNFNLWISNFFLLNYQLYYLKFKEKSWKFKE